MASCPALFVWVLFCLDIYIHATADAHLVCPVTSLVYLLFSGRFGLLCMMFVSLHFMGYPPSRRYDRPPDSRLPCPTVYVRARHLCMPRCPPTRALRNIAPTASACACACPAAPPAAHDNRTQCHHCQHHCYHDNARIVTAFSTTPPALYLTIYRIHCCQTAALLPSNASYLRSASAVFPVRPVASRAPPQRQRKPHSKSASDPKKTSTLLPFSLFWLV